MYLCLQFILDSSQSPYAQLLASSSLIKVVTEHSLRCAPACPICLLSPRISSTKMQRQPLLV